MNLMEKKSNEGKGQTNSYTHIYKKKNSTPTVLNISPIISNAKMKEMKYIFKAYLF